MPKYLVLYNSDQTAEEVMAASTPEQVQTSMAEWVAWKEEADKTIQMEWGMPLQPVARVTPDGVGESDNRAGGYATIEAVTLEAAVTAFRTHPQLKRPGASIDVLQIMPMEGM